MDIGAILALTLVSAPPQQAGAPDLRDPIALFKGVCLADEAALPHDAAADQDYDALPRGARDALGFAHPLGGVPHVQPPFALPKIEVPNRILAIGATKQIYLLAAADGSGQYASSCAVVWKGNHYADALAALRALSPVPGSSLPAGATGVPGLNYSVAQSEGMILGAAELSGWTVLRVSPDLSPSLEKQSK
jgi:hypothetical protein